MLRAGILEGMISDFFFGEYPKFVWYVDNAGEVFEAKTDPAFRGTYHGYRLEEDDDMRAHIKSVWKQRCRPAGP